MDEVPLRCGLDGQVWVMMAGHDEAVALLNEARDFGEFSCVVAVEHRLFFDDLDGICGLLLDAAPDLIEAASQWSAMAVDLL